VSGCVDHRDIVVVNSSTHSVSGWSGVSSLASEIKLNHDLATAPGNSRMLLVGIAASDKFLSPEAIAVTYNAQAMHLAVKAQGTDADSFAGIYYLLDAELPSVGVREVKATFGPALSWGHGGVHVMELTNVAQTAPFVTAGVKGDANCSLTPSRGVSLTYSRPGSLVYGMLTARGATAATLTASAGLVESWNQAQQTPGKMVAASAYVIDDNDRSINWTVTIDCYHSASAAVAIQRLSAP